MTEVCVAGPSRGPAVPTWPFRATVFLGAFLLFLVQPLAAKQILPWFGGGPAVWSSCLLFFQLALVGGYAWAHAAPRFGTRRHSLIHVGLLAVTLALLPIIPSPAWRPLDAAAPGSRVLILLAVNVGLPFIALAATAPLLQHWHAVVLPGRSPYRLYALSNAGSLIALLAYPLVLERAAALDVQAWIWSGGFVAFVICCAWCALLVRRAAPGDVTFEPAAGEQPATLDQAMWLLLPAVGSGLLVATTSELSHNVAAVPLLWVVPLAVYLVTFMVAFADHYPRRASIAAYLIVAGPALYIVRAATSQPIAFEGGLPLLALAFGALVCHGELARRKPGVGHLTEYYLAIAIGGGLGGGFVSALAPAIFDDYLELPLLYVAVAVVIAHALMTWRKRLNPGLRLGAAGVAALAVAGLTVVAQGLVTPSTIVARERNFYGLLRVLDDPPGRAPMMRRLVHGMILHGSQHLDPARTNQPTEYYVPTSGVDLAISSHPKRAAGEPLSIGVIGLGTGSVAALTQPGDRIRFYELDPAVTRFARTYFSFLGNSAGTVEIESGDARLSLEREVAAGTGREAFDVLVVDAFSGDAIPVHLLTQEAFSLYDAVLADGGVLAIHISNRYLDLRPVVRAGGNQLGWRTLHVVNAADARVPARAADWMLVTGDATFLPDVAEQPNAEALSWTDAYSSLFGVLR